MTALLGFVFGAELRHGISRLSFVGIAPPTAVGLLVVSVGVLLEHPTSGVMGVAMSSGPGGSQFRRFLLPAVLFPIALGAVIAYPLRDMGGDALTVALKRVGAEQTRRAEKLRAPSQRSLARKALALKQRERAVERPKSRTAGKGMQPVENPKAAKSGALKDAGARPAMMRAKIARQS